MKEEIEKTYRVFKLEETDGIWTALEFTMENHKTNHETLVSIKEIQYNKGIPNRRFEKRELEK